MHVLNTGMNCCVVYFCWYACLVIFYRYKLIFMQHINVFDTYIINTKITFISLKKSMQRPSIKTFLWFHHVKLEKARAYKRSRTHFPCLLWHIELESFTPEKQISSFCCQHTHVIVSNFLSDVTNLYLLVYLSWNYIHTF